MGRDIILINSTHYVPGTNKFVLQLPQVVQFSDTATVSLKAFSMYNSFFNISSSQYGNTSITYEFLGNVYNFTIPDGYYSISDLNLWLQSQLIQNNLYYTNKNNQTIYSTQFLSNSTQYKQEIDIFYIPSQADASLNNLIIPANATWTWPATRQLPILTINIGLLSYFGFKNKITFGNETNQNINYQYLSDTYPVVSPIYNILLTCTLVHSYYSGTPELMDQFGVNAAYGNLVTYYSTHDSRLNVSNRKFHSIELALWDQNFNILKFQDPELTVTIIIEN